MKFSGKMCLKIMLKVTKNQGFTLSVENCFCEKPQGGVKLTPSHFRVKDRALRVIRNLFQHEKEQENYYKPKRVNNFWSNNYIEYKSKGDRNKTLSVKKHLNKIRPYLKDIINNLKKSDTWKIQLILFLLRIMMKSV